MVESGRIELSAGEVMYLKSTSFLPAELAQIIHASLPLDGDKHVVTLSQDVAERFRDEFTNRLAKVGFDADYKPTTEGKLLESLIGRFYEGAWRGDSCPRIATTVICKWTKAPCPRGMWAIARHGCPVRRLRSSDLPS
jgi:hypothetical protein